MPESKTGWMVKQCVDGRSLLFANLNEGRAVVCASRMRKDIGRILNTLKTKAAYVEILKEGENNVPLRVKRWVWSRTRWVEVS
jgi:hypothetical protein